MGRRLAGAIPVLIVLIVYWAAWWFYHSANQGTAPQTAIGQYLNNRSLVTWVLIALAGLLFIFPPAPERFR